MKGEFISQKGNKNLLYMYFSVISIQHAGISTALPTFFGRIWVFFTRALWIMNLLFTICFLAPMSWKLAIFSDQHLSIVYLSVKQRAMSFPRGDKHKIINLTIFWTAVLASTIIVTKHPYVTKIQFCLDKGSCFHVSLQVVLVTDWRLWVWWVHYWVLAFSWDIRQIYHYYDLPVPV